MKQKSAEISPIRSSIMRAVRSRDTKPELVVRRLLHAEGYRFRLQREDLPGRPDVVLPKHRAVVFVHGCWWHGHTCRRGARAAKTRTGYWTAKIARNRARDATTLRALRREGWTVLVVWECECAVASRPILAAKLRRFLSA